MKDTYIVLIRVKDSSDARKICEMIEGTTYTNIPNDLVLCDRLSKVEEIGDNLPFSIWELSNFMDEFNNQDIEESEFFMSYVYGVN